MGTKDGGKTMRFRVEASVGNADGVFDAAYDFGLGAGDTEASMCGTPEQIGAEVARYLSLLTPEDCQAMKYDTPCFFVKLVIIPDAPVVIADVIPPE
jgi:hypothetical protein